jgi:ferrous iron transport protein B
MSTIPMQVTSGATAFQSGAEARGPGDARPQRIALLGNPNTGKTTLFNQLSGLRHKTGNFPGTTLEARIGRVRLDAIPAQRIVSGSGSCCGRDTPSAAPHQPSDSNEAELIDLPGIYSLELAQHESVICREVLEGKSALKGQHAREPDALCIVADATNLPRSLILVGEALRRRLPTVVAVNMIDLARRRGIRIDAEKLSQELGCPVISTSARSGEGLAELSLALTAPRIPKTPPGADLRPWAEDLYARIAAGSESIDHDTFTDRLDRVFTHPFAGMLVFAIVMGGLFYSLFTLAEYPMGWIEQIFAIVGGAIEAIIPAGVLRDFLSQGVVAGVGATVVFLPQICLLFFLISVLEDTGYLARAAFVMDRALRPFGLPGHAFMPLLSSHACAIPGIMATRAIPDRRQRLATILVAPFMTCSARLPVYVLVTGILFHDRPALGALAFVGCYALGILAGVFSALIARKTILRGESRPMALELPSYKMPSLRTALLSTWDRALVFLKNAGTNILAICIILWWLGAFPHVAPPQAALDLRAQAAAIRNGTQSNQRNQSNTELNQGSNQESPPGLSGSSGNSEFASSLLQEADRIEARHAKEHSFAGRIGKTLQPIFAPLGYDWQLSVGVLSSFAAREVFVSTMAVIVIGEEGDDDGVIKQVAKAKRPDGSPVFTAAVAWSLLVYYVLAMQCLPTLAVTAREAGGIKWALLQLAWMSGLAYLAALIVFQFLK